MSPKQGSLEYFQGTVDASKLRVISLPSRIWLFGGPCAETNKLDSLSLRDGFNRFCLKHPNPPSWVEDITRPEDYPDWLAFSGYNDLLLFERDAGFLSRAIIIFVESPGAMAELGAFALDEQLHRKLFVVVSRKHREGSNRRSFINLGPLKRIEASIDENSASGICVIDTETLSAVTSKEFTIIFDSLNDWLKPRSKTERFRHDNPTHKLLLIADLVDLLLVLSEEQASEALKHFGVEIDKKEIQKLAKLLDLLELIKLTESGTKKFLVRHPKTERPLLDYQGIKGVAFNRLTFKTKASKIVESDSRLAALLRSAK